MASGGAVRYDAKAAQEFRTVSHALNEGKSIKKMFYA